jgi:hypothetical protein
MKTILPLTTLLLITASALHAADPNIQINSKVISIPADSPALKEAGLTVDAAGGQSNLGIVSLDKVAAMLAKLEKVPGVQFLSNPACTTQSKNQTTIESFREFIYPTEWDAPKLTNQEEAKAIHLAPGQIIAAASATPKNFEMRPIGFRLELDPLAMPDGTIQFNMLAQVTAFEGMVNFGSPMKAVSTDKDGKLHEAILAENRINQPVFSTSKVKTSMTLPSGHCAIFGGASGHEGPIPSATQKPDLNQAPNFSAKPKMLTFFVIQMKVMAP